MSLVSRLANSTEWMANTAYKTLTIKHPEYRGQRDFVYQPSYGLVETISLEFLAFGETRS
jgi:hypothetical protein